MSIIELDKPIKKREVFSDPLSETLDKAADVIEVRGHTKGILSDEKGRVCLYGARNVVLTGNARTFPASAVEDEWAKRLGFYNAHHAISWNNAPERTQEEVINRLRERARKEI